MQTGMAKGLKIPCLFMIAVKKTPEVGICRILAYTPNTPLIVCPEKMADDMIDMPFGM